MTEPAIPVIHSIPDGAALITTVLCEYPIPKPHSCKLYKLGLNDTYLVTTERENYILRVYRRGWRNKEEIDFELELLVFLYEEKQPVAYPIARKNGSFTTNILAPEGVRYVAVFNYAPGHAVDDKLDGKQSYILGEVLAKIHQKLDNFKSSFSRPGLNNEYLLDWSMRAITHLYQHRKNDIDYLQKEIKKIKSQLAGFQLHLTAPEYGICVGDVHSGNAHFTKQNEPTLFDFDQCGYGWRAFDIAKFWHIALRMKIDIAVRNSFIEGYQAIRKLSEAELASIPVFVKAAHIWVMGISTNVVGDVLPYGWFTDEWLDQRLAMLRSLDESDNFIKLC
ncbi:phosphotransferase [Nostoc sp. CHAB 5784]|uniref:phosphotransferase enzyme family protein n=1 Tax=Nostoc mirabile TaxID=2907820 RepID=UPI001E52B17A|nr:phosphotransferase [Nostoc mirabile]MCC5670723.1 phosphotransferase [Nostoc mirabile CHAB5784]